jgi:DedD protein
METSLKQRLLGAIVLIALAVIFVPMLLSGSKPQSSSETVDLKIPPAPDAEFKTRVLPVDADQQDPGRPPAQPVAKEELPTVDTARIAPPVASAPASTPAPAPGKPGAAAKSEPRSGANPTAPVVPAAPANPPGTAADGRYVVQLGTYAETRNARDLVAALKRAGFAAATEAATIDGKAAQRVRVGPFADRAAAEAARLRIRRVKPAVPGKVVAVAGDATKDAPVDAVPAGRAGGWAVQLGALSSQVEANALRDRVRKAGFAAFVDRFAGEDRTLWRVRAGPDAERADAEKLRAQIRDKLGIDGVVVTQP